MLNFMLTPMRGPACPECGCRDTRVMREPNPQSWWGRGQSQCNHCHSTFRFDMVASPSEQGDTGDDADTSRSVRRARLRCPACRSVEVRALSTRAQKTDRGERVEGGWVMRYLKCLACDHHFKTIEE